MINSKQTQIVKKFNIPAELYRSQTACQRKRVFCA